MELTGDNQDKLQDKEINLSEIDWNNLSPEEFQKLNEKLLRNQKLAKQQERKKDRSSGYTAVNLRGKVYQIKVTDYQRLKAMKSEKSKNKLIDKIISENNSIESL
jgi:hypothetical protein